MFKRKKQPDPQPSQPAKPHVVEDMLDLSRRPAITRLKWSDGKVDYIKPGDPYPKR